VDSTRAGEPGGGVCFRPARCLRGRGFEGGASVKRLGSKVEALRWLAAALLVTQPACRPGGVETATAAADEPRASIVAMARLEPSSRLIGLGSPVGDIISEILVSPGDDVVAGQTLVVFNANQIRQAEHLAAELELERVGLQPYEIEAQRARVRSIAAELDYARAEVESQRGLSGRGITAGRELQDAELRVRRAKESRAEARAVLGRLEASEGLERRMAENELRLASSRLDQTLIRAPIDGRVLSVLAVPGERAGGQVLIYMGQTRPMCAVAEVHASEIRHVKKGQSAHFSSAALPAPIDGVVEEVGVIIHRNNVFGEDPSAPAGLRIVPVRIRLEDNALAADLTNLEGQVRIDLQRSGAP
jgi:HlyD family secretion protein